MRSIFKYTYGIMLVSLILSFTACESFLEEKNYTNVTAEEYITEDKAGELVVGIYQALRDVYKKYDAALMGTDIITQQGELFSVNSINEYFDFSSDEDAVLDAWERNYKVISRANTTINSYETQIVWSDSKLPLKSVGIAQAKALRALAYFNLVQQYGGVPLMLTEITTVEFNYSRATEEAVFNQIITDLEEAIPELEEDADFGRMSVRAAQHLLADVYLTRGYKSYGGGQADYTQAAQLAELAIGGYDIRSQTFAELFDYDNQENEEILFSIQYGDGIDYDDRNNNKHSILMNSVNDYPGIARTNPYGRADFGGMPTEFFFSLFEDNDTREEVTVHRVLYANEIDTVTNGSGMDPIAVGDTVIYYPKTAIAGDELADKLNRYFVYNPDQYYYGVPDSVEGAIYKYASNINRTNFPIFKKFDDVGFDESEGGYRDTYVYRVAESHLLAAEAYLQSGNSTAALTHINVVRERATGVADHYSSISIDDILNERAIELAGEENRWNVLKRTGKLEERINIYNPHVVDHGAFDDAIHYLRPIPSKELELSDGSLEQNFGY